MIKDVKWSLFYKPNLLKESWWWNSKTTVIKGEREEANFEEMQMSFCFTILHCRN